MHKLKKAETMIELYKTIRNLAKLSQSFKELGQVEFAKELVDSAERWGLVLDGIEVEVSFAEKQGDWGV